MPGDADAIGCYGANLMTWMLKGERPRSVNAITWQYKPEIYPRVDDEATIILQYPKAQCIIQASWNWTFSRKDMEVYGTNGYAIAVDGGTVRERLKEKSPEKLVKLKDRPYPFTDPFSVLSSVIRGSIQLDPYDQYGLKVNVIAAEILDAARRSAKEGKTVVLK